MVTKEQILEVGERLSGADTPVTLVIRYGSETSRRLEALWHFAKNLSEGIDCLRVRRDRSDGDEACLTLETDRRISIRYADPPVKNGWRPFADTLCLCAGVVAGAFDEAQLSSLLPTRPMALEVFVQPECPNCGRAVFMANSLAFALDQVSSLILDAQSHQDRVERLRIMATPTIVLNGAVRWAGAVGPTDFLSFMESGDHQDWLETLKTMIDADALDTAVALVLNRDAAADALPGLLEQEEMSYHMAMLRIVEECVAADADKSRRLRKPLEALIDHEKANIRGDAVYGLSLLRDPGSRPALERAAQDADEDVRETALDAIRELDSA